MRHTVRAILATCALAAAHAEASVDEYVRRWAHEGKSRCGAPNCRWMRAFGPINVGCRIEIDRVGLNGGAGPRFNLVFNDGHRKTIDARGASSVQNFVTRPALCEYVPAAARRNTTSSEVALLMVANSPSYLFRLWGPFLNKLLFAMDAGMRPMIWLGELPKALRKPTSEACLNSTEMRHVSHRRLMQRSYYNGTRTAGECSNHYIKMPATLATLAHPEIKGLYYVDLDSVARYPWTASKRLQEHENNFSDVSFHPISVTAWRKGSLRWHVSGDRYYARDSVKGRAFFASWFNNRCTFKDQYSLWHTILEFAAAEGCVPYDGEIFRLTYKDTRGMGQTDKASLTLGCDAIDARCPGFRYSNRGGDTCDAHIPHLLENLYHHSIGTHGKGILSLVLEGGFTLSLENACFHTHSGCEVASEVSEYASLLGVAGRDRSLHPWNSTAASAVPPVVLALTARAAQPSVGVCVVSTGRDYHSGNATGLGRIAPFFASLRGQGVRRCLISDFRKHAATAAATLQRIDPHAAVDDWFDVKTLDELRAEEPELAARYEGSWRTRARVFHRLARIISYASPPYDVTLFTDDDMYACPGVEPLLGAALLDLAATADVRLAERWLSQGQAYSHKAESRAVAQWLFDGRPPHLFRRFDLQGGAVLLRRSPSQMRFAQILRETYVDMWSGDQHQKRQQRGKDQPALDAAAARFGEVAALPTTLNLKPEHCEKGHLVSGAVRILHWKDVNVSRAVDICRVVNANLTARLVVGLSMCGLRGDDVVRLKRLKPPWINARTI